MILNTCVSGETVWVTLKPHTQRVFYTVYLQVLTCESPGHQQDVFMDYVSGLVQDCNSALPMELLQSCTKPLMWDRRQGAEEIAHHVWYNQFWLLNTLRPRQNGRHFADDIFKCIFLNGNIWISIKSSLKFVPKGPINNIAALVHIMACRRPDDNPLSELFLFIYFIKKPKIGEIHVQYMNNINITW